MESIDPVTVSINSWIELVFSFSNKCHLLAFKIHNACLFNLMTNFYQHFRVTFCYAIGYGFCALLVDGEVGNRAFVTLFSFF